MIIWYNYIRYYFKLKHRYIAYQPMIQTVRQNKLMSLSLLNLVRLFANNPCHPRNRSTGRAQFPRIPLLAAALIACVHHPGRTAEGESTISITDARLWDHSSYTRFVLDMSAEANPQIFFLSNPNRVVIDFNDAKFAIPRSPSKSSAPTGIISGYRYGLLRPRVSRLVLDLKTAATIKRDFLLPPLEGKPYRYVIDLEPSTNSAFAAATANNTARSRESAININRTPVADDGVFTVVIDAGHGGVDPGAIGRNGIYEKDVALAAAKELANIIRTFDGYQVVLTRSIDIYIPLRERVALGRRAGADLFLSLHADSISSMKIRGAHVYSLSETASDKEAEALAAKENKADIIAGINLASHPPDVSSILLDLSQRETNNFSAEAANVLVLEWNDRGIELLRKPHRQAGFAVLKAPDVPSILVELGFLSNAADVKKLSTASGRSPILNALAHAVDRYFKLIVPEH